MKHGQISRSNQQTQFCHILQWRGVGLTVNHDTPGTLFVGNEAYRGRGIPIEIDNGFSFHELAEKPC